MNFKANSSCSEIFYKPLKNQEFQQKKNFENFREILFEFRKMVYRKCSPKTVEFSTKGRNICRILSKMFLIPFSNGLSKFRERD